MTLLYFMQRMKSRSGFKSTISICECENCSGCQYKNKRNGAKGNKQLYIDKSCIHLRKKSSAII